MKSKENEAVNWIFPNKLWYPKTKGKHGSSSLLYLCMQMIANSGCSVYFGSHIWTWSWMWRAELFAAGFDVRHNWVWTPAPQLPDCRTWGSVIYLASPYPVGKSMRWGWTTLQVMPRLELVKKVRPSPPRLKCEASGDWLVRMIFSFTQQISAEQPSCWATGDLVLNRTKRMLFSWSLPSPWEDKWNKKMAHDRCYSGHSNRGWWMFKEGSYEKMWNLSWAANDRPCRDGQEEHSRQMFSEGKNLQDPRLARTYKDPRRASRWLQNPPANAGGQVRSLILEDPVCHGVSKPTGTTTEPKCRAHALQEEATAVEKPARCNWRTEPHSGDSAHKLISHHLY